MARIGLQKGIKKADTLWYLLFIFYIGRDYRIRTYDILLPKQALYQAELSPEDDVYLTTKKMFCNNFFNFFSNQPFTSKAKTFIFSNY